MPNPQNIRDYKNIAIIQTAFIGDVALSLTLADKVKEASPNSFLYFVTTQLAAPMAECSNSIDKVISYDKRGAHSGFSGIKYISDILNKNNVDCIIAPHRSLRTTLISWMFTGQSLFLTPLF